jgi:alkanesulfonate monooxygenase SsuD/methylene tetrahydromethanopterin reductase-like flavin-dependent oxidoreductase (luciferase family)
MIGGGGPKVLAVAGRQADIVQVIPPIPPALGSIDTYQLSLEAYEEKVAWIRAAAGSRFDQIELGGQLMHVTITDDPERALDAYHDRLTRRYTDSADPLPTKADLHDSPMVAIGTMDEVCAKLRLTRELLGISYFTAPVGSTPDLLAPVIRQLAGQ